jgi:hypothetical protein
MMHNYRGLCSYLTGGSNLNAKKKGKSFQFTLSDGWFGHVIAILEKHLNISLESNVSSSLPSDCGKRLWQIHNL